MIIIWYISIHHIFYCRGKDSQGEEVIKPYTPTTLDSDIGYFELVIKVCFAIFWISWFGYACWSIALILLKFVLSYLSCSMILHDDRCTRKEECLIILEKWVKVIIWLSKDQRYICCILLTSPVQPHKQFKILIVKTLTSHICFLKFEIRMNLEECYIRVLRSNWYPQLQHGLLYTWLSLEHYFKLDDRYSKLL